LEVYKKICDSFDLPRRDMHKIICEIESHNGLIVKASYDNFEFSHKSIQEYLAAEYIIRLDNIPLKEIITNNLSSELAIATCLSSNPTRYMIRIFEEVFIAEQIENRIIEEYLQRIIIEKPEFTEDPHLAIVVIKQYYKRYLKNREDIPEDLLELYGGDDGYYNLPDLPDNVKNLLKDISLSDSEKNFLDLFDKLLHLDKFDKSVQILADHYEKMKITGKLVRYEMKEKSTLNNDQFLILHRQMDFL